MKSIWSEGNGNYMRKLWGIKSEVNVEKDCILPEYERITSVHGFCFHNNNNKVLLIDHEQRGWDFPGGHIEEGELPEECFKEKRGKKVM